MSQKETSLGGLEPPTFRLTAERANRLRHRDIMLNDSIKNSNQLTLKHYLQVKCTCQTF